MPTIIPKATFLKTTLLSSHVAADGALVLQSGDGARLGSLGADQVYAVTAVLNPGTSETIVGNFVAAGIAGDTLTGVAADALGTDVGVAAGTPIQVRLTPAWLGSIQAAIHNLESVPEVAVTGAVTLTSSAIGKRHVCSGTSADYAVVLPTAVGFDRQTIAFRMDDALTRLVTIDGNGSQTINTALVRVMHAGETAVLESNGSNWVKLSGLSIPMLCSLHLSTIQGISNTVSTKVLLDATDVDNSGLMADLANSRITVARAGTYRLALTIVWAGPTAAGVRFIGQAYLNGVGTPCVAELPIYAAGSFASLSGTKMLNLAAGDHIELDAYQNSGASQAVLGSSNTACSLEIQEINLW